MWEGENRESAQHEEKGEMRDKKEIRIWEDDVMDTKLQIEWWHLHGEIELKIDTFINSLTGSVHITMNPSVSGI